MAIGFVIAAAVIAGLQYVDNYGPQIIICFTQYW